MSRPLSISLIFFLAASALVLQSCPAREKSVRISFTGDIIMHIPVKSFARLNDRRDKVTGRSENNGGFDHIFARIRDTLSASDLAVGNMEFPVSPPFESKPFVFNCRPEVLGAMKNAGIGLVTIANNHITDQDSRGVFSTISYLKQYGIDYIGAGRSEAAARAGYVYEKNGIRVGFIACTGVINTGFPAPSEGMHINNFYEKEKALEDIDALKQRSDYRVMVIHYGDEYSTGPGSREIALIHEYIDRGIDLVIGHHPHVLQRAERYRAADGRDGLIFYSLGNFISNQSSEMSIGANPVKLSTRDSVIVTAVLSSTSKGFDRRYEITPIRTVNEPSRDSSSRYHRTIQPVAISTEIDALRKELFAADEKGKIQARKHLDFLYGKIVIIRKVLLQGKEFKDISVNDEL